MFKLLNDTFIINEIIGSNSTQSILENEISITNSMPNIEKIISTEGKVKVDRVDISNDNVIVSGNLMYNIIYRSNDEETSIYSMSGKIPFTEEIKVDGATEDMTAHVNTYLDYIESELLSESEFKINAVADLNVDVINKHSVDFISTLESDGDLQAKSRNIKYTDVVFETSEELSINDAIEISKSADEISNILKKDADIYITNIDVMNDRMLVEGICKVGFLFSENNNITSTGYVSEEFPFTHYIDLKNSSENLIREVDVVLNDLIHNVEANYDNEQKIISFKASFNINSKIYDTVEKNIITDCYSTDSKLDIDCSDLNIVSTKKIKESVLKYENSFDVSSGSIKDIYSINISPKVSDKNIVNNEYIIEGFLDVNLLYLNGDINKIDRAYSSMPFAVNIDLNEADADCDISSDIKISKSNAYRKNNNSVNTSCEIKVSVKVKEADEISVINTITEAGPIDYNKMPSLIFRVVQNGETIWDIAKNYNISIKYLKELNDISNENLTPGSKIIIAKKA